MSVYKRGGIYWYDFWFREIRYRESTGLSNKTAATDAEAIRRAELAEGRAGIVHRGPIPKFEDFVNNEFLHWSEKQHEAHPRTNQYYRMSSKPLIALLGKLPLDGITTAYVERFKMVRAANVSPASTNRDMAALRYMLNFAIRQGYLTRNPVKGVKFLDEGPGFMRVVSHEEQKHTWTRQGLCFEMSRLSSSRLGCARKRCSRFERKMSTLTGAISSSPRARRASPDATFRSRTRA